MTENRDILERRLYFRSWHRGCKETDVVLGPFAEAALATLNDTELETYAELLEEDDWDIWNWLICKDAPKPQYAALLERIRQSRI